LVDEVANATMSDLQTDIVPIDSSCVNNLPTEKYPTLETLTDLMLDTYDYNEDPLLSSLDRKLEKKYNLSIPHEYLIIKDV
jgi:hypothetical protein